MDCRECTPWLCVEEEAFSTATKPLHSFQLKKKVDYYVTKRNLLIKQIPCEIFSKKIKNKL